MDFPMDFDCFDSVSSMFCLNLLLILNLTIAVLSKTSFYSIFFFYHRMVSFATEIHRLGPMDLKIYTLPSKKPATVTRQLTKSTGRHMAGGHIGYRNVGRCGTVTIFTVPTFDKLRFRLSILTIKSSFQT
jgi:hypothetical protein